MKLNCPKCASNIRSQDIHLDNMVAKCSQCDEVFGFGDKVAGNANSYQVPKPERIVVGYAGSSLQLTWRWFTWLAIVFTIFTIVWNAFIWSFIGSVDIFGYNDGNLVFNGFSQLSPMFCLPHFWIGLFMAYYTLTLYVNKTTVVADFKQLTIRHAPLPWWGNHTIQRADVEQLYTKEKRGGKGSRTYEVHAILQGNQKHKKVLSGLQDSDHALYVEQELERYWGIVDRPVSGEYGRR